MSSIADQDYEISLDPAKRSKIKLSPIPQDVASNPIKFNFPPPDAKSEKSKEIPTDVQHPIPTHYEELNYDEVLSKTVQSAAGGGTSGPHLEQALDDLINQDEEGENSAEKNDENAAEEEEEKVKDSNQLSSSRAQQEEDNPINPIKDFATKTSRIFADSESSKLNSSIVSQRGIDPFMITNSSVMSTYLYKPQFPPGGAAGINSNMGSQLPSPSKTSSSLAGHSTGFRTVGDYPPVWLLTEVINMKNGRLEWDQARCPELRLVIQMPTIKLYIFFFAENQQNKIVSEPGTVWSRWERL